MPGPASGNGRYAMIKNPEGRITIRLSQDRSGRVDTQVTSSRPLNAIRWFAGKSADDTLKMLPMLYRVCGIAQSVAAVEAVEQARGQDVAVSVRKGREMLVLAETLREHLLRIFIGWQPEAKAPTVDLPRVMRLATDLSQLLFSGTDPFSPGGGDLQHDSKDFANWLDAIRQLVADSVLGCPADTFLQLSDPDRITEWATATTTPAAGLVSEILRRNWADAGQAELRPLPAMNSAELESRLQSEEANEYVATPDWRGEFYETGAFARSINFPLVASAREHWGDGLLSRILARLAEVASLTDRLNRLFEASADAATIPGTGKSGSGTGIGQVEAARGRLVHRVILNGERVTSYQMLAPTEWNFHPRGVVVQSLNALRPEAELERLAGLLIEAVDPCVGYDIELAKTA